jgi:hypothetical protein
MRLDTEATDELELPEALKVENRKPPTPEKTKKVERVMKTKTKTKPKPKTAPPKKQVKTEAKRRADGLLEGSSAALLVDTVLRKQGATNAELCKAVGWKQCLPYLRKSCEQAGVKLRTEKPEGELTRYFGTARKSKKAS